MKREPEDCPWFQRPLALIAFIFFALTVVDAVERLAERAAPTHFTQQEDNE